MLTDQIVAMKSIHLLHMTLKYHIEIVSCVQNYDNGIDMKIKKRIINCVKSICTWHENAY